MSEVDPTTLFGFNPNSLYAKLFVDIYKLTTPNKNQDKPIDVDANMNIKFCDNVSDDDEMEEGEIDDNDNIIEPSVPIKKPKLKKAVHHRPHSLDHTPGQGSGQASKMIGPPGYPCDMPRPGGLSGREMISKSPPSNLLDLQAQIDLDNNPARLHWLHLLLDFMQSRGTPIKFSPTNPTAVSISSEVETSKEALDLYSLYQNTNVLAGGLMGCTETKGWRQVAVLMNVPVQKAFVLRSIYQKYLFPFEEFQKNKERKALLPTPVMSSMQGTSFQAVQGNKERRFCDFQRGRGGVKKGNIKKRLGFKKKGGNFKRGGPPPGFGGFHG